jgi:hypothetical protein
MLCCQGSRDWSNQFPRNVSTGIMHLEDIFLSSSVLWNGFHIHDFWSGRNRSSSYWRNRSPGEKLKLQLRYFYFLLHGLSPRANCTDRATAACRRSDCQLVRIEGATWLAWRIPPAVFSRFSRQEPLLFYEVAPQLYSRGWVDPVSDPLLFSFPGSAGNRTRAFGSVAKNSDH